MIYSSYLQKLALLFIVSVFCWHTLAASTRAHAQDQDATSDGDSGSSPSRFIEVVVLSSFDPEKAVGILFSERGTVQQPVPKPKRIDESFVVVRVPYKEDLPRDTMVTAVLYAADGRTAMGSVRPVFSPDSREAFLSIPDCAPESLPNAPLQTQLSMLESLVQLRSQRRGIAQVKVAQQMSDAVVSQLRKLERGFGLRYESELSADLPPIELIDRLNRILSAIRSVRGSDSRPKSPTNTQGQGSARRGSPGRSVTN